MTPKEIKAQLMELIDDRKSFIHAWNEDNPIYINDIEALEAAVGLLEERTAHWDISCDGYYPYCSACRKEPPGREMSRYCPNCGYKMVTRGRGDDA